LDAAVALLLLPAGACDYGCIRCTVTSIVLYRLSITDYHPVMPIIESTILAEVAGGLIFEE
jgi:hypothetical protein